MAEERHHGFLPPRAPDTPEDGPAPERPPRLSVGASGPGSREGENRAAVASLWLGVSGLIMFVLSGFGLLFILNLPLSILAWVQGARGRRTLARRDLATAGMVTGIVGSALGVLAVIGWVLFFLLADDPLRLLEIDRSDAPGIQIER